MKIRYNGIFIPILIICIIAVWWVSNREKEEIAASRLADRALVDADELDIIELTTPEHNLRLEKIDTPDGNWNIVRPYAARCNTDALNALIASIFEMSSERDFEDVTGEQLEEYGLVDPELRLRLASTEGVVLMEVEFGRENTSGAARYARFADKDTSAFLVPIYDLAPLQVSPDELRDLSAISFEAREIEAIQLSSSVAEIRLSKEEGNWMVTSPSSFPANPARVAILVQNLEELDAVEFLSEGASDPELSSKSIEVELSMTDGSRSLLTLYGEDISRGIFATSSTQPSPFIVEPYIEERLSLDPDIFFYTLLIDFPAEQIARVHIRQPGAENLEISRTGEGPEDWSILKPEDRLLTELGDFSSFITALTNLQPEDSVPIPNSPEDYGLEPVYFMKIEVYRQESSDIATIYLGSKDENGNYYATQDGSNYFTIADALVDDLVARTIKLKGSPG